MTPYKFPKNTSQILSLCAQLVSVRSDDLQQLEQVYAELDLILDNADETTINAVLSDSLFKTNRSHLHIKRAHYEYDRELALADAIINKRDAQLATTFRSHNWYDKALDFEIKALAPYQCKSIAFVGAGPFPTSAMAFLADNPTANVSCMERSIEACLRAREVAAIFDLPALNVINAESFEITDFSAFDCVIVGLVVGAEEEEKASIVQHFVDHVPHSSLLCFRSAHGAGQVIYPSVELAQLEGRPHTILPNPPHKSFTLIIVERDA